LAGASIANVAGAQSFPHDAEVSKVMAKRANRERLVSTFESTMLHCEIAM